MSKVLITGGTGMIGSKLSEELSRRGHEVMHLSRSADPQAKYPAFAWDIHNQTADDKAFDGVEIIVHLAGATINQRWTEKNRKTIIDSRVESANLLFESVQRLKIKPKAFISMSAIGYYGADTGDKLIAEADPPGDDFMAEVVTKWEKAADQFNAVCPVTKLRTGVVLDTDGGALPKIATPIRFGVGAPLGSGKQWMSWVHIDDVVHAFAEAVDGKFSGTFNLVASQPETNASLSKKIAEVMGRPFFFPNVPAFVLKIVFGEMAGIVLGGNKISNERIIKAGYTFKFAELETALKDLLK